LFADFGLLEEVVDFLLKVPSAPSIGLSLDYRLVADFAVAGSVLDLVLVLCGAQAQCFGLTQQLVGRLAEPLTQKPGMATTRLGDLQGRIHFGIQPSFFRPILPKLPPLYQMYEQAQSQCPYAVVNDSAIS